MMTVEEIQEHAKRGQEEAAWRTLDILTQWLREHPRCSCVTTVYCGKFKLTMLTETKKIVFQGESIQDVYAQAAQTISFNGGTL